MHVLAAEVEQVWIPFGAQFPDEDLALGVGERDRGHRLRVAPHLGAGTHGGHATSHPRDFKHLVRVDGKKPQYGRAPSMMTCVPIGTSGYRRMTSALCMRMHPCEA